MKESKLFLALFICGIVMACIDLGFGIYVVYEIITISGGGAFVPPYFWIISLVIIILNALTVIFAVIYWLLKKFNKI